MKDNILKEKTLDFSIKILTLFNSLKNNKNEKVISNQIVRSGTSIGANVNEAEFAQSRRDFIHKCSLALKEANETKYWIKVLKFSDYINEVKYKELLEEINSIISILVSSVKTAKKGLKKQRGNYYERG